MRHIHGGIVMGILLLLTIVAQAQDEQAMRLVYFVEHEDEQEQDLIEVELEIEAQSRSLVDAISAAGKVAGEVTSLANSYCKEYTKKGKGDCKQAVEVEKFQIEPQYQMVRKQATFSTFVVTHSATVKVFNPQNIGYLVDSFLKYPQLTLKGFSWLPLEEVDAEEAAVKEGMEQGEDLCRQIGLVLTRVIDIQEIDQPQPQEQEGDEEEQGEQQEAEVTVYRFQVECSKPKKK